MVNAPAASFTASDGSSDQWLRGAFTSRHDFVIASGFVWSQCLQASVELTRRQLFLCPSDVGADVV